MNKERGKDEGEEEVTQRDRRRRMRPGRRKESGGTVRTRREKDVLSNWGVATWETRQGADTSTSLLRGQTVGLPQELSTAVNRVTS